MRFLEELREIVGKLPWLPVTSGSCQLNIETVGSSIRIRELWRLNAVQLRAEVVARTASGLHDSGNRLRSFEQAQQVAGDSAVKAEFGDVEQ